MKKKYLMFVAILAFFCARCSEKMDNPNTERQSEIYLNEKSTKLKEFEKREEIHKNANLLTQCLKSQKIDTLKDSIRIKFLLDSCSTEYMPLKKGVPPFPKKYGVRKSL
jgi:hypothetical protein